MVDREKVIKGLELCSDENYRCYCQNDCPYLDNCWEGKGSNKPENFRTQLLLDAIELLKEQEPKTAIDIQLSRDGFIFGGCPKCKALITHADHKKYCGYCGQAVKWE